MIDLKDDLEKLFEQEKAESGESEPDSPALESVPEPNSAEEDLTHFIRKKRDENGFREHSYKNSPSYDSLYHSGLYNTHTIQAQQNAGIDRLKLYTNNYQINRQGLLTKSPVSSGYHFKKKTASIKSWTTENRTKRFALIINPEAVGINAVKCFDNGMQVDMNPATVLRGNNIREIRSLKEMIQALESVQQTIEQEYQIKINLLTSLVSYVELCKTEEMPRAVSQYTGLLNRLSYPRMDRTPHRSGNVTFSNGRHSIVCYDKKLHLQGAPSTLLRIEHQLKERPKVEEITKKKLTPLDMYKKWGAFINRPYNNMIDKLLGETNSTQAKQGLNKTDAFRQAYRAADADGKQAPWKKAFFALTIASESAEQLQEFSDVVKEESNSSMAYHVRKVIKEHEPYADAFKDVSLSKLRKELRDTFAE